MVYQFISEFSRQEAEISRAKFPEESPAARQLAESNGYGLVGVRYIPLGTTNYTALVVERPAKFSTHAVDDALRTFRERGCLVEDVTIAYKDGKPVNIYLVVKKAHKGGGTATLEMPGSLEGRPVSMFGSHKDMTLMGYFANTDAFDIVKVEEIAELLHMLPTSKQDVPPAFADFLKGIGF